MQRLFAFYGWLAIIFSVISTANAEDIADPSPAPLQTVTLEWDALPTEEIQTYRVYVGTESQQYTQAYDSGTEVSYTVGGLEYGRTYYFSVSAVDTNGLESAPSTELMVTLSPPPLPLECHLSMPSAGAAGPPALEWSFPQADVGSNPEFIIYSSEDLEHWDLEATVPLESSTDGDSESLHFSWPIQVTTERKFFRLTARNWMGESALP